MRRLEAVAHSRDKQRFSASLTLHWLTANYPSYGVSFLRRRDLILKKCSRKSRGFRLEKPLPALTTLRLPRGCKSRSRISSRASASKKSAM